MLIKKGQLVEVCHVRKGNFRAIAREGFDTETADSFPLAVAPQVTVPGRGTVWEEGDRIPCKKSLCSIKLIRA